jgi:hypothetical protein
MGAARTPGRQDAKNFFGNRLSLTYFYLGVLASWRPGGLHTGCLQNNLALLATLTSYYR